MVGHLESRFSTSFQGRQVFTYHDGRLLSHWLSFYQHHTTYHVNGFGGCWWGLHFTRGKHRYSCAPIWRFCTVSSRQIHPSDSRLSFLSKPVPSVLTHIHNKKVQTIPQRSPVKWRVETWLVVLSQGFPHLLKEGRYSLTTSVDCCLIDYPFTNITPHTMWMGLGGVGGVSTSREASIGTVVLQFGDFAPFQAGKSVPAMVDCHFSESYCPMSFPSYNIRCLAMNSGGLLLIRDRIGRKRLNQPSRQTCHQKNQSIQSR